MEEETKRICGCAAALRYFFPFTSLSRIDTPELKEEAATVTSIDELPSFAGSKTTFLDGAAKVPSQVPAQYFIENEVFPLTIREVCPEIVPKLSSKPKSKIRYLIEQN